jgi:hypothetical protein
MELDRACFSPISYMGVATLGSWLIAMSTAFCAVAEVIVSRDVVPSYEVGSRQLSSSY